MSRQRVRAATVMVGIVLMVAGLGACSPVNASVEPAGDAATSSSSLWDTGRIHDVSVTVDDAAAYEQMIATYLESGDKTWISATVTIDGVTFSNVGLKLKGNSSLRGLTADQAADAPETIPWLIRLDKFVDGQSFDGETELVVRGNNTETSLNEAVALQLLGMTGLATQQAIETRFAMNGSAAALRLVVQNPNDAWADAVFDDDAGLLYKAETGGDYSYRGDDPAAYASVFDQEAGEEDLTALISFLEFINEADDATFTTELPRYLDVAAFATYLAFQDLIVNFDDISGPGNNSYLHYDTETGSMTVVSWDLNLAFGRMPGGSGQLPGGNGQLPGAGGRPGGSGGPAQGGGQGMPGGAGGRSTPNVLAERFLADAQFEALYTAATAELTETLYASGAAQTVLDQWVALLTSQATDLVSTETIDGEAAAISSQFPS